MLLVTQPLLNYIKEFIYFLSGQFLPTTDNVFKIASYLVEENNREPDLYTIGNLTVYTIVLFAHIVIEAQFCLQWSD